MADNAWQPGFVPHLIQESSDFSASSGKAARTDTVVYAHVARVSGCLNRRTAPCRIRFAVHQGATVDEAFGSVEPIAESLPGVTWG